MSWLAGSREGIALGLCAKSNAMVSKTPLEFESPVSYEDPGKYAPRDDDHIDDEDEGDEDETMEDDD